MLGRRKLLGGFYFALLMLASFIWAFSIGVESITIDIDKRILWSKISYVGIVFVAPLWVFFALKFSQAKSSVLKLLRYLVLIVPLVTLFAVLTNDLHKLVWPDVYWAGEDFTSGLVYEHGIVFYIHLFYAYLLLLGGAIILTNYLLKSTKVKRSQVIVVLASMFIPWIGNILYNFFGTIAGGVELTPVALTITGLLVVFSVYRFKFLAVVPVAKETIYSSMKNGVIIVDRNNTVLDFNPMARKIVGEGLGIDEEFNHENFVREKIDGYSYGEIKRKDAIYVHSLKRWYRFEATDLAGDTEEIFGKIISFFDITDIVKSEQKLTAKIEELSRMNEVMLGREMRIVELKNRLRDSNT
jgi:hypothetical protein